MHRVFPLLLLMACGSDQVGPDPGADGGSSADGGGSGDGGTSADGGTPTGDGGATEGPDLAVDVLVIGSGPAGMAAAWEAREAGASVLVVERDDHLGGGGNHARNMIAAGTRWQAEVGLFDTPDQLLLEWSTITAGGDPGDPWVQRLAFESAGIIDWLVDDLGASVGGLGLDQAAGSIMRLHVVNNGDRGPVQGLVDALEDLAWTDTEATALRIEGGAVAGAYVQDLLTGETLELAAAATVIATGGFARDLDRVEDARPELVGATVVFEALPSSDGGGHGLLDQAGASWQNLGHHGLYVHSVADPRAGLETEAVVLDRLEATLMVGTDGHRLANEATASGFSLVSALAATDDRRLWAVFPAAVWDSISTLTLGPSMLGTEDDLLSTEDLETLGVATRASSAAELGASTGIDATNLQASLDRYAELIALGEDLDFGKRADAMVPLGGELVVVELAAGSAKSFGGAWLDEQARVLDADGQVIAGLYAAGEAAGMLGTEAVGVGFSGSVTACYLTGRVAGRSAAERALAR